MRNRRFLLLVVLIGVMLGGGLLTSGLLSVPTIVQSESPDASVFQSTGEQAAQFFLFVGFVLVNLIGAGVTLMLVFWLLNRWMVGAERSSESVTDESPA